VIRRPSPAALLLAWLLIAAIASAPSPARAEEDGHHDRGAPLAGVGALLCTLVYSPLKLTYAATGLVVGGMATMAVGPAPVGPVGGRSETTVPGRVGGIGARATTPGRLDDRRGGQCDTEHLHR